MEAWQWDWDDSGKVDIMDLQVFAEYWLYGFDFTDFANFANQWQKEVDQRFYNDRPDFYYDGIIDFKDFAIFANEWGKTGSSSQAISISVNGDANNLRGEIGVGVAGCTYSTLKAYVFMDGQLLGELDYDQQEGMPGITINTPSYLNGSHSLKAAIIDQNGLITLSGSVDVNFNNPLYCLNLDNTYEPNQPLRLLGISATDSNLRVNLSKWDGGLIWSQQITGNLDINIPGNFLDGQIYDVSIERQAAGFSGLYTQMLALNSNITLDAPDWEQIWQRAITAKYDPNESYKFVIFLPTAYYTNLFPFYSSSGSRRKAVAGIVNDCNIMGIKYIILYECQCTWENFSRVLTGPKASSIIYVYVVSRGGSQIYNYAIGDRIQRTWFRLSDGYLVSHFNPGEEWRGNVHSMASLGLEDSYQLKLVWIDVCLNGLYPDMANAWMKGLDEAGTKQLYVGWNGVIQTSNESCFSDWTAFFFGYPDPANGFGLYGANTYYQAFIDTGRWNHVCDSAFISGRVQTYGDTSVRFTGERYDFK